MKNISANFMSCGLCACLMMLTGCASLLPSVYDVSAVDRIFIHESPKPGDFAVYGNKRDSIGMIKRYEIAEVDDTMITIRWRMLYTKKGYESMSPKDWFYLLVEQQPDTDFAIVKDAWAITDKGERKEMTVAATGQPGSLQNYAQIKEFEAEIFTVGTESIPADSAHFYTVLTDVGMSSAGSIITEYHSNKVPFKMIARRQDNTINTGKTLRGLEFIAAAGEAYQNQNVLDIQGKVTPKSMKYDFTFSLLEYAFAD